jgi:hypothetical protein
MATISELLKKPYQEYGVSPTIKSYTLWSLYDEYIKDYIEGNIGLGGRSGVRGSDYDIVLDGTGVTVNNTRIRVDKSKPLGIINPYTDKLTRLHYLLLDNTHSTRLKDGNYRLLSIIPNNRSITPQHLIVEIKGNVNLHISIKSNGSFSLRSFYMEIFIHSDSRLNLLIELMDTINAPSDIMIGIRSSGYSKLNYVYLVNSGLMSRFNNLLVLNSMNTYAYVRGIGLASNSRLDNVFDIIEYGRNSFSYYLFTSALINRSIVAQRGIGRIDERADDSGIEYYSEALLLSRDSYAYLQPKLEINTGKVSYAKHHARNVHVLPEQIFYLQTRGIDKINAEKLVVKGYLVQKLPRIKYINKVINNVESFLGKVF